MSLPAMCTSVWQIPQNLTSKVTSSSPATFLSIEIFSNLESGLVFAQAIVLYIALIFSESDTFLPAFLPFIQNTYDIILIAQQTFMTRDEIQLNDRSLTKSGCFLGDRVRTRQRSTPSFMGYLQPSTHTALRIENATLPTPSWSAGSATKISENVRNAGTCFTHITDILWTSLWVSAGVSQSVSPLLNLPNSNPWSLLLDWVFVIDDFE